jgi:putative thioredoxin
VPQRVMGNVTQILEVGEATFERDVIQRSHQAPVVVDFWADWCGPCRTLGPVLERLAMDAEGAWTLAKVDVDSNPRLAQAFGIQGIPAVRAFKDGRQVAEFTGALPEARVRAWLAGLGPSAADEALEDAERREGRGDFEGAAAGFRLALDLEPGHDRARRGLERVELRQRARDLDGADLRARAEAGPLDSATAMGLADLEVLEGRADTAFGWLLAVVRTGPAADAEAARRHLLRLMDVLSPDDPRVNDARRALSRALF